MSGGRLGMVAENRKVSEVRGQGRKVAVAKGCSAG